MRLSAALLTLLALLPSAASFPRHQTQTRAVLRVREPLPLRSSETALPGHDREASLPLALLATYGLLPLGYSLLVDTSLNVPTLDTPRLLLLVLAKRAYLYTIAVLALDFVSNRASEDFQADFGARFGKLNERLFGVAIAAEASKAAEEIGLSRSVAEAPESSLALLLPVVVSSALLVSYLASSPSGILSGSPSETSSLLATLLPLLVNVPVLGVCFCFCKAEIEALTRNGLVRTYPSPHCNRVQ